MEYEFEGRTEQEAIDKAVQELGLEKDNFDVEILESQKHGLFKKGFVKIKIHTDGAPAKIRVRKSNRTSARSDMPEKRFSARPNRRTSMRKK